MNRQASRSEEEGRRRDYVEAELRKELAAERKARQAAESRAAEAERLEDRANNGKSSWKDEASSWAKRATEAEAALSESQAKVKRLEDLIAHHERIAALPRRVSEEVLALQAQVERMRENIEWWIGAARAHNWSDELGAIPIAERLLSSSPTGARCRRLEENMEKTDDGGPAFPFSYSHPDDPRQLVANRGISIRDYFAGQAMAAFITSPALSISVQSVEDRGHCADWAYDQADAMLKARDAK